MHSNPFFFFFFLIHTCNTHRVITESSQDPHPMAAEKSQRKSLILVPVEKSGLIYLPLPYSFHFHLWSKPCSNLTTLFLTHSLIHNLINKFSSEAYFVSSCHLFFFFSGTAHMCSQRSHAFLDILSVKHCLNSPSTTSWSYRPKQLWLCKDPMHTLSGFSDSADLKDPEDSWNHFEK